MDILLRIRFSLASLLFAVSLAGVCFAVARYFRASQPAAISLSYLDAVESGDAQAIASFYPTTPRITAETNLDYSSVHLNYVVPGAHRELADTFRRGNMAAVLFRAGSDPGQSEIYAVFLVRLEGQWKILQNSPEALSEIYREGNVKPSDMQSVLDWVATHSAIQRIL